MKQRITELKQIMSDMGELCVSCENAAVDDNDHSLCYECNVERYIDEADAHIDRMADAYMDEMDRTREGK